MSSAQLPRVRVLIVDDHPVLRMGLAALFGTAERLSLVGEAGTAAAGVTEARRTRPDVVVMDVRLPDMSGVEACREIRSQLPDTRVVMLTSYPDEDAVIAAIVAGASGYLLKHTQPERLLEAVEAVAAGGSLLDPGITQTALNWMRRLATSSAHDDPLAVLSEQERRMLPLIAEGKTNREIALVLSVAESTVKTHVSDILRKLQLHRRAEVAAFATRHRAADPPT